VDLKIFDFSSLFQVALGMNLAVPFFPDAMARNLLPIREMLQNLIALKDLVPEEDRGAYLGDLAKVRRDFQESDACVKRLADRLSVVLIFFAIVSFAVLYESAIDQELKPKWCVDLLLAVCFMPPILSVLALYLFSRKRSTDVRIAMQEVYDEYIERQ
jgi:hypothetical protein